MRDGKLLRREPDGSLVTHADLSAVSQHPWGEMVVDGRANAYVGNIGFDFPNGEFAPGIADGENCRPTPTPTTAQPRCACTAPFAASLAASRANVARRDRPNTGWMSPASGLSIAYCHSPNKPRTGVKLRFQCSRTLQQWLQAL